MPGSDPQTGGVYYYPYLWKRQYGEPDKDRPCCVVLRLTKATIRGADTFLLALSQSGYPTDGYGIKLPKEAVLGLKRLDASQDTYLVTSEFNSDTADHPSFADCEYLGSIPRDLREVLSALIEHIKNGSGEVIRNSTRAR